MSETQTGVTVTLKAGTGFEAPWIVIHAESVTDAKNQIDTGDFAALAERTVAAAEFFRSAHSVKTGLPTGGGQQAPAPQQAYAQGSSFGGGDRGLNAPQQQSWSNQGSQQQAPQFAQPAAPQGGKTCIHGDMTFREGVSKTSGKPYRAFFCPAPKGTPNQCAPEFLR